MSSDEMEQLFSDAAIEFSERPEDVTHQGIGSALIEQMVHSRLVVGWGNGGVMWTASANSQLGAEAERLVRKRIALESVARSQPRRNP